MTDRQLVLSSEGVIDAATAKRVGTEFEEWHQLHGSQRRPDATGGCHDPGTDGSPGEDLANALHRQERHAYRNPLPADQVAFDATTTLVWGRRRSVPYRADDHPVSNVCHERNR